MSEKEPNPSAFRVNDRRRFDREGNLRDDGPRDPGAQDPSPPSASPQAAPPPEPPPSPRQGGGPAASAGPAAESAAAADAPGGRIGFPELIMSVATTALAYLGHQPGDSQRVPGQVNLPMAAQNIDIIAMLQEKTRGNLTAQESELLDSVLYDLRTLYVQTAQNQGR